jgi:methyl-accepting chemotaxis protein
MNDSIKNNTGIVHLITSIYANRPWLLAQLGVVLLLPWGWAVFVMPPWVSAVCAGLLLPAFLMGIRYLIAPIFARRRAIDDESLSPDQVFDMRAQNLGKMGLDPQTLRGDLGALHGTLGKWQDTSHDSSSSVGHATQGVGEVISQTEQAVIELSKSFRGITVKTRQQMETAMSMLRRNEDGEDDENSDSAWVSLPDYIHAYERQLQEVIESMVKFSMASDEMFQHQTQMRDQSVLIDEMVDELRSMAIHIGRLALDTSMVASDSGGDRDRLVQLTDSIRGISDQTLGLTRNVRERLETIRDELVVTYKVINRAAITAKESAQRAKADVSQLNVTMIEKSKEVEAALTKINSLGKEIQQDVNNAIIAMQFQDITQQKLEHMRGNILSNVIQNLDLLSAETQEMMKRDIFRALKAETERQNSLQTR